MQTIRQYEIVAALATHRHFGRAATALGVSQPSLTRSLNRIEELLGGSLFDRAGCTPTIFGEIVLRHGGAVLASAADLTREISLTKGLDLGELSVAVAFYPADISGYEAAALLTQRHPGLSVRMVGFDWSRGTEAVLAGAVDLAFADISVASQSPDFDVYPVREGPLSFFCASWHPLARRKTIDIDDLTGYPWVGPRLAPQMSAIMPKGDLACCVVDSATGQSRPRIQVETFDAAKRIVRAGEALSAAVPFQIREELAAGQLTLLPVQVPHIAINYGFILKRGRLASPATKAFMQAVRKIEKAIPEPRAERKSA